jgi:hypothetical protein
MITFGDSWTAGHGVETNTEFKEHGYPNRVIDLLRRSNSWPRWLSDYLKLPFVNLATCGNNNLDILRDLRLFSKEITDQDLVIVMLSTPYRPFEEQNIDCEKDQGLIFQPVKLIQECLDDLGCEYFIVNSFYPTYRDYPDQKNQINTDKFLDIDGCVADMLFLYEAEHDISVWEYNCRKIDMENDLFLEGDYHPNLLGYKIIGSYLYELICQNR